MMSSWSSIQEHLFPTLSDSDWDDFSRAAPAPGVLLHFVPWPLGFYLPIHIFWKEIFDKFLFTIVTEYVSVALQASVAAK